MHNKLCKSYFGLLLDNEAFPYHSTVSGSEAGRRLVPVRAALEGGVRGGRGAARQARGHTREGTYHIRKCCRLLDPSLSAYSTILLLSVLTAFGPAHSPSV